MRSRFSRRLVEELKLPRDGYVVLTLHREANVDYPDQLRALLTAIVELNGSLPVVFPIHPRTRKRVAEFNLGHLLKELCVIDPVDYLSLMGLVERSRLVVTDSGGLQKEAYFAGKRAVVLLGDPGWRELVECGWNVIASADDLVERSLAPLPQMHGARLYGDGDAARKIAQHLLEEWR